MADSKLAFRPEFLSVTIVGSTGHGKSALVNAILNAFKIINHDPLIDPARQSTRHVTRKVIQQIFENGNFVVSSWPGFPDVFTKEQAHLVDRLVLRLLIYDTEASIFLPNVAPADSLQDLVPPKLLVRHNCLVFVFSAAPRHINSNEYTATMKVLNRVAQIVEYPALVVITHASQENASAVEALKQQMGIHPSLIFSIDNDEKKLDSEEIQNTIKRIIEAARMAARRDVIRQTTMKDDVVHTTKYWGSCLGAKTSDIPREWILLGCFVLLLLLIATRLGAF